MPFDADNYRAASHDQWEHSAEGWAAHRDALQRAAMPVSTWMIEAIEPQPGQTVLELAAGPGDTGLMAAELVAPGGKLISSDFAESMLNVARARAAELGIDNVDFRVLNAESLDLETASTDAILCRWGYMLMADPGAALRESRRVLRPGGRLALAAWDSPEHNPWVSAAGEEMSRRGHAPPRDPDAPSMFAFAKPGRIEELLEQAGFMDVTVEPLEFRLAYGSVDDWWTTLLACGRPFAQLVEKLPAEEAAAVRDAVAAQLASFAEPDGGLVVPGRTLVASASA
jgi:ubiquinone/menaquinone biosynthesis C-methylase UbiE